MRYFNGHLVTAATRKVLIIFTTITIVTYSNIYIYMYTYIQIKVDMNIHDKYMHCNASIFQKFKSYNVAITKFLY